MPQTQHLQHAWSAEIEIAIVKPELLVDLSHLRLIADLEWKRLTARVQYFKPLYGNFNVTRGQPGVLHAGCAMYNPAQDTEHVFGLHRAKFTQNALAARDVGTKLNDARAIPQINEDEVAVISD